MTEYPHRHLFDRLGDMPGSPSLFEALLQEGCVQLLVDAIMTEDLDLSPLREAQLVGALAALIAPAREGWATTELMEALLWSDRQPLDRRAALRLAIHMIRVLPEVSP